MKPFIQVILYTSESGQARFREQEIPYSAGNPQVQLTDLLPASGLRLRHSPPGFRSEMHVTTDPQWVFILRGRMEIGLFDGSSRIFGPGEHFYSADTLPEGVEFNPRIHGHWSRQVGDEPLVTAFIRS
ncbi:MAG TPA: hypothetical protein VFG52_00855 [Xanthomonadales bacterium]|nr:hypothetical protein [Xanthomonadales bacterium]